MDQPLHEVQFTSDVAGWINLALTQNGSLPFSKASIEGKAIGSQGRRDLTLWDRDGNIVLTGEVKLPWAADGHSPLNDDVVNDARKKAHRAKTKFFFTWNINEFLLWETNPPEDREGGTFYHRELVAEVSKPGQLEFPEVEFKIRSWLRGFLYTFANFVLGKERIARKPLDVRFLETVESNLQTPVLHVRDALKAMQKDPAARKRRNDWMRSELGWTVSDVPEDLDAQLLRASKYACYVFVNKLAFHEALQKRFKKMLPLRAPEEVATGEELRQHLSKVFADARETSGDYETVFGEDRQSYGDTVPFRADAAVPHWKALIDQLDRFNFSKLDYDTISNLFEKLITPEERSKYGQFFTRVEVVDLINSFCMPNGDEVVMDPACGGGTFLVRAYARMKELQPRLEHTDRLANIYGVDIEHFPVHLSTINLTVRELIEEDNYPRVVRHDFLTLPANGEFGEVPRHEGEGRKRRLVHTKIPAPRVDAIITNPPYIRQEEIGEANKKKYQKLMADLGLRFSGRSDIHIYFWPHAAEFLKDDGYIGIITSSQWLDVDYGFKLQEWLLKNFRIVALLESEHEPWFEGARVATTVTILQRESDQAKRDANLVRFVQVRRPLREVMGHGGNAHDCVSASDAFRDELLGLTENTVNERYRVRLIPQQELWEDGLKLGEMLGKSQKYYGGKWGMYLRAPDLWFEILDNPAYHLVRLGQIAEVRFGVKSGKDAFFFPIDVTEEALNSEQDTLKGFQNRYGVTRAQVESGEVKLVRCGEGRGIVKPIESQYLEPEVHSLMEIDGYTVGADDCSRMILLLPTVARTNMAKFARKYVEWGEEQGWHALSTCAGRQTTTRDWYDLTGHSRGQLFWPMGQQYKHAIALNKDGLICNHNLFDVHVLSDQVKAYAGLLNSSWTVLSKFQYGRPVGVEGNLKTEVIDVKMMLVPDPRHATPKQRKRIEAAFEKMAQRPALQFLSEARLRRMAYTKQGKHEELKKLSDVSELEMPDRRELDDAVLEMMGVADAAERAGLIDRLYEHLRWHFERTRQKEEQAIENKNRTRRHGQSRPEDIAAQINRELEEDHPWALKEYQYDFLAPVTREVKTLDLPKTGDPQPPSEVLGGWRVEFIRGKRRTAMLELPGRWQAELLAQIATVGIRGLVWIPSDNEQAQQILTSYREFLGQRQQLLNRLVEERTDDPERQEKIMAALISLIKP